MKGNNLKIKNPDKPGFEAAIGFEPMNKGFADLRLRPLGHAAEICSEISVFKEMKLHKK